MAKELNVFSNKRINLGGKLRLPRNALEDKLYAKSWREPHPPDHRNWRIAWSLLHLLALAPQAPVYKDMNQMQYSEFLFYPHPRTCLLILERGEGRERGKETSIGCLSHTPQLGNRTYNLGPCPDRGWNHELLVCGVCEMTPNALSHLGQG